MANVLDSKIILDGPRNAKVRVTGILDTADLLETVAVAVASFTNNDVAAGPLTGFRVNEVEFTVTSGLLAIVEWKATTNQLIGAFADANEVEWEPGLVPDAAAAGYTGGIVVRTLGWAAPAQGFTFTLDLIKLY